MAMLHDAIEDAEKTLAEGLLPVIDEVRTKITTWLKDPSNLQRIKEFGNTLADGFRAVADFAGKIPWNTIGEALKIGGQGARAVLDAFVSMPAWVQTAVLTGWGLNKLSGGTLSGLVGELGKGLIKGVLGMNAAVVNINAATVNGGGGGSPTSLIPKVGGAGIAAAAGPIAVAAIAPVALFELTKAIAGGDAAIIARHQVALAEIAAARGIRQTALLEGANQRLDEIDRHASKPINVSVSVPIRISSPTALRITTTNKITGSGWTIG